MSENTDGSSPIRAGRFFTQEKIKQFQENLTSSPENKYERKGEFFSKNVFEQLLSVEGCEGLLIYYGLAPENNEHRIIEDSKDNLQPRLFLVPVKTNNKQEKLRLAKEISFFVRVDGSGKDVEDEYGGAGGGQPHPPFGN